MKSTAAQLIKAAIERRLHPPLPLDQRQSQRIVDLVSSSFRKNLAEEHARPARSRPVDAHLRTILNNPLFQPPPPSQGKHDDARKHAAKSLESIASPLDFFNHQVSLGKATLELAQQVSVEIRRGWHGTSVTESQTETARQALASITSWLWASGSEETMTFLQNRSLTTNLMTFVVYAGRDDVFWRWFQTLLVQIAPSTLQGSRGPQDESHSDLLYLLSRFLREKYRTATTPDGAVRELEAIANHPIEPARERDIVLRNASACLSAELLKRPVDVKLSRETYGKLFKDNVPLVPMSNMTRARLALLAPQPDASLAASILCKELIWLAQREANQATRQLQVRFSFRTIEALLGDNRGAEARRIACLLKKHLPQADISRFSDLLRPQESHFTQLRRYMESDSVTSPFSHAI